MPLIVGIAGGTASGKTTLARATAERLGAACLLVAHDRYYRPGDPASASTRNYDHPDALDTDHLLRDLDALRAGRDTRLPIYDFAAHDRVDADRWDPVAPCPVVLVEGILVLAVAALRETLDVRVFVDAPDDVRLARRIRRDIAERGRSVDQVLDQYERTVRPMHTAWVAPSRAHADLLLDGTMAPEQLVVALVDRLSDHLGAP